MTHQQLTLTQLKQRAQSGGSGDVDYLMQHLDTNQSFAGLKLLDFALGLVSSPEGVKRIEHFLFNGSTTQRNYAALYFKRRGSDRIIDEAVRQGCVDSIQAYAR